MAWQATPADIQGRGATAAHAPAMLVFEVRPVSDGALLSGASCMSGTPAATMRAMNSSGSIVREVAFTVSMKDAAEYCRTTI